MLLVQVKQFGTGTRYGLEILHQCDKKLVRGGGDSLLPPFWIGLMIVVREIKWSNIDVQQDYLSKKK